MTLASVISKAKKGKSFMLKRLIECALLSQVSNHARSRYDWTERGLRDCHCCQLLWCLIPHTSRPFWRVVLLWCNMFWLISYCFDVVASLIARVHARQSPSPEPRNQDSIHSPFESIQSIQSSSVHLMVGVGGTDARHLLAWNAAIFSCGFILGS